MTESMKNPQILVTAPGKVILFGEHSVVYGKKALAASIEKRMKVKLFSHNKLQLELVDLNCVKQWELDEINLLIQSCKVCEDEMKLNEVLLSALKTFLKIAADSCTQSERATLSFLYLLAVVYRNKNIPGMRIEVQSEIPVGAGLGSSAAYLVSLAGALLANSGALKYSSHGDGPNPSLEEQDLKLINSHAFLAEHIFHGRPSGLDNMISVFGNALVYGKSSSFKLCTDIPEIKVVVVDTNVTRSTRTQVEKVRQKMDKYPDIINHVFDTIHHITEKGECVLGDLCGHGLLDEGSRSTLNDLIDMNQMLLNSLGAGHPRIDEVVGVLGKFSIHGKLTGAGGGGSVLGLVPPDLPSESLKRMTEALQSLGFTCHFTTLGTKGVTIRKS